jgi:hypothetical protein
MKISQREARRLRKRVDELERVIVYQRSIWSQEYIDGVQIAEIKYDDAMSAAPVAVRTARKIRNAVVVAGDDTGRLRLIALPTAKV